MTIYGRILLAGAGSAALLIAAFAFQYLGGLAPCPLCIWQRWPHAAAVLIGAIGVTVFWRQARIFAGAGAAAMATSAGLALYHVGVEQGWWQGPGACSAASPGAISASELLDQIMATPLVRCDEVAWEMWGISMAGWNGVASLGLGLVWLWSVFAPPVGVVETR